MSSATFKVFGVEPLCLLYVGKVSVTSEFQNFGLQKVWKE